MDINIIAYSKVLFDNWLEIIVYVPYINDR